MCSFLALASSLNVFGSMITRPLVFYQMVSIVQTRVLNTVSDAIPLSIKASVAYGNPCGEQDFIGEIMIGPLQRHVMRKDVGQRTVSGRKVPS